MLAQTSASGIALTVALNVLLVGTVAVFIYLLLSVVFSTERKIERLLRAGGLFIGAMIVLGAQASGLSYAEFVLDSLTNSRPVSFGVLGVVAPGAAGVAIGWYLIRAVNRSSDQAVRVLAILGTLSATQFLTFYGVTLGEKGFELGAAAVPNITFLVGVFLYIILNLETGAKPTRKGAGLAERLLARVRDEGATAATPQTQFVQPGAPSSASAPPPMVDRHSGAASPGENPFISQEPS